MGEFKLISDKERHTLKVIAVTVLIGVGGAYALAKVSPQTFPFMTLAVLRQEARIANAFGHETEMMKAARELRGVAAEADDLAAELRSLQAKREAERAAREAAAAREQAERDAQRRLATDRQAATQQPRDEGRSAALSGPRNTFMVFAIEYVPFERSLIAEWDDENGTGTYVLEMAVEPANPSSLAGQPVTVSCHATDIRRGRLRSDGTPIEYHRACRIEPNEEI